MLSGRTRKGIIAAAGAASFLLLSQPASAAPANDNFGDAQDLGALPFTVTEDNTGGTAEPGEPGESGSPFHSVWFKWIAANSGPVHIDLCDSVISTPRLKVYTGTAVSDLTEVARTSIWECAQTFEVNSGTTYYVSVDAVSPGEFTLDGRSADPPANDDFANAMTVMGPPLIVVGSTYDASAEVGEPIHEYSSAPTKSVWYRWVAPFTREIDFESNCTGVLSDGLTFSIYTGSALSNLVRVGATPCFQTLAVTAGTTYWIAANAFNEGFFNFRFGPFGVYLNDDFSQAATIQPGLARAVPGSTQSLSWEDGEPDHFDGLPAEYSAWHRWVATTSGPVSIDTCESDFDSVLAVYAGVSVDSLARLAESDDASRCQPDPLNPLGSAVTINAVAGNEYRIAVDGYETGGYVLKLQAAGPQTAPAVPQVKKPNRKRCAKRKAARTAKKKRCKKGKKRQGRATD